MFELTNEQRKFFALIPVSDKRERIEAKPSPYDKFKTYLYLDGILSLSAFYREIHATVNMSYPKKSVRTKSICCLKQRGFI